MRTTRRFAAVPMLVAAACSLVLLTACRGTTTTSGTTTAVVTLTPTPQTHPSTPSGSRSPTRAATSPPAVILKHLPGECLDLLSRGVVTGTLGKKLAGPNVFVVGEPDRSISRLSYINCRYGGNPNRDEPDVEIQVSLYSTAAKAAARVPANIIDFEQHGARPTKVTVHGMPATLLIGGHGVGYYPTVVMAAANRTVAVSIKPGVLPSNQLSAKLVALAALAERRTSGP